MRRLLMRTGRYMWGGYYFKGDVRPILESQLLLLSTVTKLGQSQDRNAV